MDVIGDRKFVEVPGGSTHELPPLLLRGVHNVKRLNRMMEIANDIIEKEDMLAAVPLDPVVQPEDRERRK